MRSIPVLLVATSLQLLSAQDAASSNDGASHRVQFVGSAVRLEVLDWGGTGRPVLFLSGYGDTAHVFDRFAPKLTDNYRVYGVTRRGFGASESPASGYTIEALAEDVRAVFDALKLDKPILVGHSIAGDEMTFLASRYPDRIGALVYLEGAYDRSSTKNLPAKEKLELSKRYGKSAPIWLEIKESTPKPDYAPVRAPALAFFGGWPFPPEIVKMDDGPKKTEAEKEYMDGRRARIREFQTSMPAAEVADMPDADHYVFRSHEADVLREIRSFLARLQ